jgi:hypothetical protein
MSTAPALNPDDRCPRADGYILHKALGPASTFAAWEASDGAFLGLIERLPERQPVYHVLCDCGGHFIPIGNRLGEQPSRDAPAN